MIWKVDPILFKIPLPFSIGILGDSIELRYYGALFALGVYLAYKVVSQLYKRRGLPLEQVDAMLVYTVIPIVIFAHLIHLIFYEPRSFIDNPIRIIQIGQGLASHGAFVGILFGVWLFSRKNKLGYVSNLDMIAIVTGLTGFFIRIGNFFNHEILGRETTSFIGVLFAKNGNDLPRQIYRHPAQLYEATTLLILFIVMYPMYLKTWKKRQAGFFSCFFLVIYFSMRVIIETIKEKQSDIINPTSIMTMGQWLSLPVVIVGIIMLIKTWKPKSASNGFPEKVK